MYKIITWSEGIHRCFSILFLLLLLYIHPSIHFHSHRGAGDYPSCHSMKERVHPDGCHQSFQWLTQRDRQPLVLTFTHRAGLEQPIKLSMCLDSGRNLRCLERAYESTKGTSKFDTSQKCVSNLKKINCKGYTAYTVKTANAFQCQLIKKITGRFNQ